MNLVGFSSTGGVREDDHVRKVDFNRHLVAYRPMHRPSLFQMNGCSGGQAEAIKYFAAEEFPFLDRSNIAAWLWHSRLRGGSSPSRVRREVRRTGKNADFGLDLRTRRRVQE